MAKFQQIEQKLARIILVKAEISEPLISLITLLRIFTQGIKFSYFHFKIREEFSSYFSARLFWPATATTMALSTIVARTGSSGPHLSPAPMPGTVT